MKEVLIKEYNNLENLRIKPKKDDLLYNIHFIGGAFCEIRGAEDTNFRIEFIDKKTNEFLHYHDITNNMWTRTNTKYFIDYLIKIKNRDTGEVIHECEYDAKGKRVMICFDSKAIGDTLAWFPYVEEFRKKHECEVVISTFHNEWFKENYPDLEFIEPGDTAYNLYARYDIGWYYNEPDYAENNTIDFSKTPTDFRKNPLGKTCSDILGLDFKEIKPKLTFKNTGSTIEGDYVVIAPHGSAHAKYWNRKGGWQDVIDHLNNNGYKVVMITQEPLGDEWHDSKLGGTLKGVIDKTGDAPLSERANDMMNAKAFIGIGSGLSWLAWGLGTPVVMISGFSEPYSEFEDCERVFTPEGNCNGCFNRVRLNAGDWEWCPDHKDTDRHYECTKSISSSTVISAVNKQLGIL